MNIVIVGHVDHGKSTVIGRLLADTGSLPEGKLEQIKEMCRRNSKPFEYAFLLDALKDERSQGITIDTARCFFHTAKRQYIIIDAPGHIEFLKNMITGAARAEAALLVIDAHEGIQENSRRHGYMLSMLGIKQVAVLVNKMDLVDYDRKIYNDIVAQYSEFLNKIHITPKAFIPVSAMAGDNITVPSPNMPWYAGRSVLDELDDFDEEGSLEDSKPLRMPVQDVYKFTGSGDERRIIAGTIESGLLSVGDEVVFYPSGKRTTVKTIEEFNRPAQTEKTTGWSVGFTTTEQIYVRRGELCSKNGERAPRVSQSVKASIFWLGTAPMTMGRDYVIKIGSAKVGARLTEIIGVLDASSLAGSKKDKIERHDVAEVILTLKQPIAYDLTSEEAASSRFVIVDGYEIAGGGIVTAEIADNMSDARDLVMRRNLKWERSAITPTERAARYSQRAAMIIITGNRAVGKKDIARRVERMLFDMGRSVYFLGIGNVLYGVVADIKTPGEVPAHDEHIRRLGEVANLMLDAGMILLVTAAELTEHDIALLGNSVEPERIRTLWLGGEVTTDIKVDTQISEVSDIDAAARAVKSYIEDERLIFRA